tara:strand:- start:948 stop:1913 length:966 start_codon:yes stop_codon:yes gene_type:complete
MNIAFHSQNLGLRGTDIALYDYAKYNEKVLGNTSFIISGKNADLSAKPKFDQQFPNRVKLIDSWGSAPGVFHKEKIDWVYITGEGKDNGFDTTEFPTFIHAVFRHNEPHGNIYAYISDWLARDQGYDSNTHSLPYICEPLPQINQDLRSELNIPTNAKVFGCYGGSTEFNIHFVHEAIKNIVNERSDVYFIFMNINKFCDDDHEQIIHLPGSYDMLYKSKFVNTCDAMIHARSGGETFGLAVAEFASSNKPVITYKLSGEANHIEMLGERGIYYEDYEDLKDILNNINSYIKYDDYYKSYEHLSPESVMRKFDKFIKGKIQ